MSDKNTNRTVKGCLQLARSAGQYPCQSTIDADLLIAKITDELEQAQAKIERLTNRGIEDMKFRIDELESTLKTIRFQAQNWYQDKSSDGPAFTMKGILEKCDEALGKKEKGER